MFEALSRKWNISCGKGLNSDNSYYLACKAFNRQNLDENQFQDIELSYIQFVKFWEYFESMMNLTEQRLDKIWNSGYLTGFINKLTAEEMLKDTQKGTFLIRFSDSTLGGVTIGSKSSTCKLLT